MPGSLRKRWASKTLHGHGFDSLTRCLAKKKVMSKLEIGTIVNTVNKEGSKQFPISKFYTDENKNTWASLGELKELKGFNDGYYGEREWLVAMNNKPCWQTSNWKVISG